ncbi:prolyl oligopeptidase family serine peptidase [Flavobacterium sp. ACN6]|uniref:S9 family peptidase n=1 Tax=Flavobacterium sp. ACN6 TaxID=1920426 RepID=UPI000BB30B7B|nr:prolyl oligopeptidase family serine peptidase [Flavobacterium sp. ACN6]PBJ08046.1 x-prolyl-dipeptidyl aminopeptidase [Flavobacterium sp. ACN6]
MKKYIKFVCSNISVIMFGLVTCPALGQDLIQRQLTKEDYKLWSRLQSDKISSQGKWVSYYLKYESRYDTLFVRSTNSDISYFFPEFYDGRFANDEFFACLNKNKELQLLNLVDGNSRNLSGVKKFGFDSHGKFLITLEYLTDKSSALCIRTNAGKLLKQIENIIDYQISPNGRTVLYAVRRNKLSSLGLIQLSPKLGVEKIITADVTAIKSFTWSKDGNALAFYTIDKSNTAVCFYSVFEAKSFFLTNLPQASFENKKIYEDNILPLKISDDNSAVFFSCKDTLPKKVKTDIAEIWKTDDKYLFPEIVLAQNFKKSSLAVWQPHTKYVNLLSTEKLHWIALTGAQKFAVVADPTQYEPQFDLNAPMDYYLMSTAGGKKELLASKQSGLSYHMNFSPCGRYICYYNNSSWILYDIKEKKHTNITAGINSNFQSIIEESSNRKIIPYLFQGWSEDVKSVLLCDQYDIWQINLDGKPAVRLTNGREKQIRYRLVSATKKNSDRTNYYGSNSDVYDTRSKIILEVYDTKSGSSGYGVLDKKRIKLLYFNNEKISRIIKSAENDSYIFESEKFNQPPRIIFKKADSSEPSVLFHSNEQQKHFYWGSSEFITFENSKKQSVKGALFYPAQYNPSIKYPMIVYIYDKLAQKVHTYENPSFKSGFGFNITHFTANGYFVLLPDIEYEIGNPGLSASDCVESAVKSINQRRLTDPKKIGLIGHSFGSYESNCILTESGIFAAAVSGAGISDNIRGYFTVNSEFNNAEAWRFENQQYRMGSSLYENKEAYIRNSPLLNAEKVNTPILLWTGKNDNNVQPEQSTAFFLALRRLNKKAIMLQYPEEGHIITSPAAQQDLNHKIMQWFDYYLKGDKADDWMFITDKEKTSFMHQ